MSVAIVQAVADEFKRLGGNAVFADGWANRGNGQSSNYGGLLLHHTAGGNNIYIDQILITGRSDLAGPLCNFCIMYDGDLGVIAAHPANHAGASGGWDTAPYARSGMFNREIMGVEIQYKGTEPMAAVQYESAKRLTNAVLTVLGKQGQYEWIKFHQGTSIQGKWDPGYDARGYTYDIVKFRDDARNMAGTPPVLPPVEVDMPDGADVRVQMLGPSDNGWVELAPQPDNQGNTFSWFKKKNVTAQTVVEAIATLVFELTLRIKPYSYEESLKLGKETNLGHSAIAAGVSMEVRKQQQEDSALLKEIHGWVKPK